MSTTEHKEIGCPSLLRGQPTSCYGLRILPQYLGQLLLDGFAANIAGDDGTILCYEYSGRNRVYAIEFGGCRVPTLEYNLPPIGLFVKNLFNFFC